MVPRNRVQQKKQDPKVRATNFQEVAYTLDQESAEKEAKRCLQCRSPLCVKGCPVFIDIPKFIRELSQGDLQASLTTLLQKNSLPAVCGRVCPQETQCEGLCVLARKGGAIAIGALERYVADWASKEGKISSQDTPPKDPKKGKVAVIGSGPAGLTCASELARNGYAVTIFEALHLGGGVLRYGIPEFRLPKAVVDREIRAILDQGVTLEKNCLIGQTKSLSDLFLEGFRAVFIGTGAGLPTFLGIPGENLNGVYSANEFLTRVNLMNAYRFPESHTPIYKGKKVAVIGGGNVAMDAARTALRLCAEEVTIVYRRGKKELPARLEEIENAEEEGIIFKTLMSPEEILGDEKSRVRGLICQKMVLSEPDASGRPRPVPTGEYSTLELDTVVVAVGQGPNPILLRQAPAIELNRWGCIVVQPETMQTNMPGVFAAGDIVTGAATVIQAMGDGRKAAHGIMQYLQ